MGFRVWGRYGVYGDHPKAIFYLPTERGLQPSQLIGPFLCLCWGLGFGASCLGFRALKRLGERAQGSAEGL